MRLGRLTTLGIAIVLLGVVAAFASSVVLATEDACASGGAVADPDSNPGLVADCAALLAARDTLAGTATINWAAETPIAEWDGVTVEGTPLRVTRLTLSRKGLTGEVSEELGDLSNLEVLSLSGNQLTGEIPTELGALSNLEVLFLSGNQLTGEVPTGLGNLSSLERLSLISNQLTGVLPEGLTGLSALESFHFYNNPSLCASVDQAFQAWLRSIASAIGSSCATVDSVEDRAVLVELYDAMDGENWTANTNWLSDRPIREWHGVTIDTSGRVNGLVLVGNGLTGELPMELVELSNLTHLILSGNQLEGEIPTELGSLSNLRELYLSVNQLTGEIPTQLGDLSNLTRLSLSRNQLTGRIPTQLGSLSNLTRLFLDRNQLTGEISTELGNIPSLTVLSLSSNQLTGEIPTKLGDLSNLEYLGLGGNQLTGEIPTELGDLSDLQTLDLSGNQLSGELPQSLTGLTMLVRLFFDSNAGLCAPTDEAFQAWLQGIAFVRGSSCVADSAEDRAVLVELHNATDGANWTNNTNWLSDEPMRTWHGVTTDDEGRVSELSLSENRLAGEIPTDLGNLPNLTRLELNENQLAGGIPTELGNLSSLQSLDVGANELTGEIPVELTNLSSLEWLSLWGNELTGEIPTEMGNLSNLQTLDIGSNQLTGEIPSELGNSSSLEQLWLASNKLTGEIPTELGNLSNLRGLGVNDNQLTGEIPTELGSLSNLTSLRLHSNELTGEIPTELGNLSSLTRLRLHSNELTGEIPTELGNLSSLEQLWLGSNQFTGELPTELGNLSSLLALGLNNNQLTGELPAELGSLSNLQTLDLGSNQFTGDIPTELGNLSSLEQLWLGSNQLTGELPTELGNLSSLLALGLNNNQLTGELPQSLTGLTMLARLSFDNNAGLCAPTDEAFQAWLQGVASVEGSSCVADSAEDRVVLVELYNATDGANWTDNTNWLSDEPIGTWHGVTTDDDGRVAELSLGENQLTGEIPTELGDLTNLQSLQLNENQLTGGIPVELGGLSSLQSLDLGANQLAGEIPTELGNLSSLDFLSLWENELTGEIPTELGNLSKVQALSLAGNQLTGEIPAELGSLSSVEWLDLGLNQLTGEIPAELGSLSNLQVLYLNGNRLTGEIPTELGSLSNLQELYLNGNRLTGEIPAELGNLSSLETLGLRGNYFPGCVPGILRDFIANLRSSDMSHLPACTGFDIVHDGQAGPRMYGGNLFVLPIEEELATDDELPLRDYVARFFEYFDDEFDFLVLLSNFDRFARPWPPTRYAGQFHLVKNDVQGIGLSNYSDAEEWGSEGTLQGVPHLAYMSAISEGPLLHELMHRWANFIVPTGIDVGAHWGFSSANGQLGGFDIADLVDHGDGRYSAGVVAPLGWRTHVRPYSPIELYLAGLMQPEEVPDLWVAEDGQWLTEDNRCVMANDGDCMFTASTIKTYTIEDIATEHGERIPNHSQSQRDFRAAAILLVDEDHPLVKWQLDKVSSDISSFSYQGADEYEDTYNFYEATGGRATITLGGLSQFLKDSAPASLPGVPTDVTALATELQGIDLSWNASASDGFSAITAYDLRYIESAADETEDSNWTVREDVWTTGSGALRYTLTGLTAGTEYDLQVRAVNAVGDGPWSETVSATLTTTTSSICVTGGAVGDATNTGLVSDCEALLTSQDTLAGSVALNWAADTPVAQWEGVAVRGTPQRVTRLDIRQKGLDGTIPGELGLLSNLTLLNLRTNQLTGTIPAELGNLSGLERMLLHGNRLTGPIPNLSGLSSLKMLWLSGKEMALTGPVPSWLNSMSNLESVSLWGNDLRGPIPDLTGMTSLNLIKLQSNGLTGTVPTWFADMDSLRTLYLHDNELTGTIPAAFGRHTRLLRLWLDRNNLTGSIPSELADMTSLRTLNLRDNQLSGSIPAALGDMSNLQHLRLHNNRLSGSIPAALGDMSSLRQLWVSNNRLSGSIPAELGDLSNLQQLNLHTNQLSGAIPSELGKLTNLTRLRIGGVDGNRGNTGLIGCVPSALRDATDPDDLALAGSNGILVCASTVRPLIAFASDRDGDSDIYVMSADGSGLTQLTDDPGWFLFPAWSPDGEWIAFASDRDGDWNIYIMKSDGSGVKRLTNYTGNDAFPAWSPDGEWIAFESYRDGDFDIHIMRADGSDVRRLLDYPGNEFSPAWSPDGEWLAFESSTGNGAYDIYVVKADGTSLRQLTDDAGRELNPDWSPDGGWIAFQSNRNRNDDIFVVRADGSSVRQLTHDAGDDAFPTWSPDGEWIAFHSFRDGDFDIYVMRADGSDVSQLTNAAGGDAFPVWSPRLTGDVGTPAPPPPTAPPYYTQSVTTPGVTVKATAKVDPMALQEAAQIVSMMLDGRQGIADCMAGWNAAIAIVPDGDPVTALPEFAYLRGTRDMWGQYRDGTTAPGLGGTKGNPVTATPEEFLLGEPGYPPERDVHEPAHLVQNLCFTEGDYSVWTDLHSRAVDKVHSVFGFDTPPFDWGLMVNIDEFFAGLSQYYFFQNDPPRRYAKQFFPQAFAFLEEFYGILTPKETDRPGYVQYVTASGIPLPWLVPGGFTYEHSTFGYSIELLPGWKVEREGVHDVLLSGRNWPWPEIRIEYTILPDGTGAGDPLVRLAESRIEGWEQSTLEWDKTEVRSFERVSDGQESSYWIYYYGHESPEYCDIDQIERVLIASHNGRSYGVVLQGVICGAGNHLAVGDIETMLRSYRP